MAFFGIRFDLRNPSFAGTAMADRYEAALDMVAWAEQCGFVLVTLSEHHGSPDGYLPAPLPLAAAIAARTERIAIYVAAIVAPFHDPIRLAEDAAVVDIVSRGRLNLVVANGYVPSEFEMFDVPLAERAARTRRAIEMLRQAWTGEPFEHDGRTVHVTPPPFTAGGPNLLLGGSSDAAARRAARLGVGYQPSTAASWEAFRAECAAVERPDPGPHLGGDTTVTILARDADAAWAALAPYALHEANAYGAWAEASGVDTGYRRAADADELRGSGQYRVLTPDELLAEVTDPAADPFRFVLFHPMLGGVPPELAWEGLHLFEHEVLPNL